MATHSEFMISPCTICETRDLSNAATAWCPECEDALCDRCKEHHRISKGTRNHDTIPVEDCRKLPPLILNIKPVCEKHNEKFQMYCLNHEKPLCMTCIVTTHKGCKDTKVLKDVTANIKSSWAMEAVEKQIEEIIATIQQIKDDREKCLSNINGTKDKIIKEISRIREQVNRHLDKIQKELMGELKFATEKREKDIRKFLEELKTKERELGEIRNNMDKIKLYASDFQSFCGLKEIENIVNEDGKYLQQAFDDGMLNQANIECTIDGKMEEFPIICPTFGKLTIVTTAPTIKLQQQKSNEAQIPAPSTVSNIRLQSEREIKVGDSSNFQSTGCCVMSNGNIIFACFGSKILAIHGSDGSHQYDIPTGHMVYDLTLIDQRTVAATTWLGMKIIFVDIQTKQNIRSFDLDRTCSGITYRDGSLFVCVKNIGLQRLDMKNMKLSTIFTEDFGDDAFVATFEDKTFLTNYSAKTLKVLDAKMNEIWRFYYETFLKAPTGVTVDKQGNVYIAENKGKCLVIVSADGKQRKHLEYQTDISSVYGLCYEKSNSRIIAVGFYGEALFLDFTS